MALDSDRSGFKSCQWGFFIGKNKDYSSGLLMRLETMSMKHKAHGIFLINGSNHKLMVFLFMLTGRLGYRHGYWGLAEDRARPERWAKASL